MPTRFIAGIYNYCNRWCERCPKTGQCLVYASQRHYEALAEGRESRDPHDDLDPPTPEAEAFMREVIEAQEHWSEEDSAEFDREQEKVGRLIGEDPLDPLSKSVDRALHDWWLAAIKDPVDDPLLVEARELIGHYGIMLRPKVHRALHGYYLSRVQSDSGWLDDANGTAKLMLLAIEELLPAVEAVALADPADRKLRLALANLPVVRALLLERFPGAMAYVRPGWDD